MTSLRPDERLAPFVRQFTVVETDAGEEATRVLIPNSGLIAGFRFAGSATLLEDSRATRMPDVSIAGLRTTARRMVTSAGSGIILAVFRATGAAQFFAPPLHELFGDTIAIDDAMPRRFIDEMHTRIAEAPDHRSRAAIVEEFLLGRRLHRPADPLVEEALLAIGSTHGRIRIAELARRLGISQNSLERRFRQVVGASPKQYGTILRLRHAVKLHRAGATLTEASISAGYFDQPHWNRQFKSVTGAAPQQFFNGVEYC